MAVNLSRNTKVYFTTNVDAVTGVITNSGFTAANLIEIQVMDGYKFAQSTNQATIQLQEAGSTPNRGQRSFNTELAPVDWSLTTYIRPRVASTVVTAAEKYLWNAIAGDKALNTAAAATTLTAVTTITRASTTVGLCTATGAAGFGTQYAIGSNINIIGATSTDFNGQFTVLSTASTTVTYTNPYLTTASLATATGTIIATGGQWAEGNTTYAAVGFNNSNKHQLQKFGLVFKVDSAYYLVDNCAVDQAQIDFGIDQIAQIAWSGKGTAIRNVTIDSTVTSATIAVTTAQFITNKLSTVTLSSNINGDGSTGGSTAYNVPITGGSLTIANNLTYLTPQILGTVNSPIGYFTGTRAISGSLNAYLRVGAGETATLLSDLLTTSATATDNKYHATIALGGKTNSVRVEFDIPAAMLQIPSVEVADVVSTSINFTGQAYQTLGSTNTTTDFNIDNANELMVKYFSV